MGRIANLSTEIDTAKTPISKEIDNLVNIVTAIAVVVSLIFFILAFIVGFFWLDAVIFLIGIIIANVPEGLLGTIAVCLTLSARRLAWKNCLVKNMESVESLGATSLIVTDMTGTLTQNKMQVGHYWLDDEIYPADGQRKCLKHRRTDFFVASIVCGKTCQSIVGFEDDIGPLIALLQITTPKVPLGQISNELSF